MNILEYENQLRKGVILEEGTRRAEAAPLPGFSAETFEEMLTALQEKNYSVPSVAFALESLEIPFPSPDEVPTAHFGCDGHFHDTIKLKLGDLSLEDAIEKTQKATKLCHHLRVDINQKWPLEKALAFVKTFPNNTFEFIEEPTKDLYDFLAKSDHPVAVDEHLRTLPIEEIVTLPITAAVIKPMLHGGFSVLKPLVEALKKASITPILSSTYETSVGLTHLKALYHRLDLAPHAAGLDTEKLL